MSRRVRADRCPSCGGPAKDCVDNHGRPYRGCASGCRILSAAELAKLIEPEAKR